MVISRGAKFKLYLIYTIVNINIHSLKNSTKVWAPATKYWYFSSAFIFQQRASWEVFHSFTIPFLSQQVLGPDNMTVVGKISNKCTGVAAEYFTNSDSFGVQFPVDLDVTIKATLIGASFLIVSRSLKFALIFLMSTLFPRTWLQITQYKKFLSWQYVLRQTTVLVAVCGFVPRPLHKPVVLKC